MAVLPPSFEPPDPTTKNLLKTAVSQLHMSARAYHRTRSVKLARAIVHRAGSERIQPARVAEAPRERRPRQLG